MEQLHCKNCGAPIEHKYTHRCKYCDTVIFSDEEISEEEHWIIDDSIEDDKEESEKNTDIFDLINQEHIEIDMLKGLIMAFVSLVFIFVVSNLPYIIKFIMEK